MKKNKVMHNYVKKITISVMLLLSNNISLYGMQQAPAMISGAISHAESQFDQLRNSLHAPMPLVVPGGQHAFTPPAFAPQPRQPIMQRAPVMQVPPVFGAIPPQPVAFSPVNNPPFALARPGGPVGMSPNRFTLPTHVSNQYGYGVENGN